MAVIIPKIIELTRNKPSLVGAGVNITNSVDGCVIDYADCNDGNIIILIENSGATNVECTIIKGDGLQGVSDFKFSVAGNSEQAIVLESGKFKFVSGVNKDKVVIKGPNALKFKVFKIM